MMRLDRSMPRVSGFAKRLLEFLKPRLSLRLYILPTSSLSKGLTKLTVSLREGQLTWATIASFRFSTSLAAFHAMTYVYRAPLILRYPTR